MNVKVCLIVLLCLLSISIVCSVATRALPTITLSSHSNNNKTIVARSQYLTLGGNDTQPDGEGKGGGGWPL